MEGEVRYVSSCVVAMSFVMKHRGCVVVMKQRGCDCDRKVTVVLRWRQWLWTLDRDSGCGLAITKPQWLCDRDSGCGRATNVERTLTVTILAGTSDFPPELRGCSNRAHNCSMMYWCVHIYPCCDCMLDDGTLPLH